MDKFSQGIVLYSDINTHETYLELWGGSTKHPDVMYRFSEWKDKCDWLKIETLIFQWVLYCASRLSRGYHSAQVAEFGLKIYDLW